jgi:type VI protein secretion system component VasF
MQKWRLGIQNLRSDVPARRAAHVFGDGRRVDMPQVVATIVIGLIALLLLACAVYIFGFLGTVLVSAASATIDGVRTLRSSGRRGHTGRVALHH